MKNLLWNGQIPLVLKLFHGTIDKNCKQKYIKTTKKVFKNIYIFFSMDKETFPEFPVQTITFVDLAYVV